MKRRDFLRMTTAAGVAGALTPLTPARAESNGRRANILFLMDDQHRGDCLGGAGATWLATPNLDRLAREGIRFDKAYCSLPSCIPARASLLTGMSPWGHGLLLYAPMAERYAHEKPRLFTEAGYRTHAVGKMHFGNHRHGYESIILEESWRAKTGEKFLCDYRRWFNAHYPDKDIDASGLGYVDHRGGRPYPYEEHLHPTFWTAQQGIDFLETYRGDRPWFLKVSFVRPHPPFDPPERLMQYYEAQALPEARVGAWAERAFGRFEGSVEKTPNAPRGKYPNSDIHRSRAAYYAAITHVDEQVGRVLKALERRGELENTLILFTADHGDMMGDQYLWRKTYAYEASARIPMIVRWPKTLTSVRGAERGIVSDRLVELRDVLPTFLDAAGIAKPSGMEGMSLLDLVRSGTAPWRDELDLEHGRCYWDDNAWTALTDGRYKYIYFTHTGQEQLFDLRNDPHELQELSGERAHRGRLRHWRGRMIAHLAVRGEPWVRNGDLGILEEPIRYGANHPPMEEPEPGA